MNKKTTILIAAVILLLILLFVGKGLMTKKSPSSETAQGVQNLTGASNETTTTGSLFDLLKSGANKKCTYSGTSSNTTISGTTYIAGGHMRTDAQIKLSDDKQMETHMISDGTWIYTWGSAMPGGFKMKVDAMMGGTAPQGQGAAPSSDAVKSFQDKYDFKCSNWGADNSVFVVPTDVQFTDFSQMMPGRAPGAPAGQSASCAACNYIQDASAKAQCLSQLGCK